MKSLVLSLVVAAAFGVVLSLPFDLELLKKQELIPMARTLGATDFARYVHEANLTANFTRKAGNFTLFIPVNKAWSDLAKNITRNRTLLRELILYHSVNGTFRRGELKQGTKLRTLSGRFLTFNVTKDRQSVFVNGVNITKFNQRASNGYIFLIGSVLVNGSGINNKTNTAKPSKEALIPTVRDLGATRFAHYVHEANLTANFTKKAGNFTLFVPINSAWEGLSKNVTRNQTLLKELVLFHSVNGTYTRADLKEGKKLETLSGRSFYVNVTKEKDVFVDGVNITKFNLRASNGNIFLLGAVMLNGSGVKNETNNTIPTKAYSTRAIQRGKEALIPTVRDLGATKFAHYVHEANLTANFTRKAGNFTLFVPINSAWEGLSKNITRNQTLLKELVLFHSVNGTYTRADLKEGKKLETLSGRSFYVNVTKEKDVFVDGVNITKYNQWASNGNIFLLGAVMLNGSGVRNGTNSTQPTKVSASSRRQALIPNHNRVHEPQGSITHILSKHWSQFSSLITDLMKSGVWSELENDHITLLAPTNVAFQHLTGTYMHNLDNDPTFLEKTMKYHILNGVHSPNLLHPNSYLTTVQGHRVHVTFRNGHAALFNAVPIVDVIHATNGVIYVMGGVLHVPIHPVV